ARSRLRARPMSSGKTLPCSALRNFAPSSQRSPEPSRRSMGMYDLFLQPDVLADQLRVRIGVVFVHRDAFNGTDLHALRFAKMPHAFGAFIWVDHVDGLAHRDGLVGTLGLAHIAVDALIGDLQ